MRCFNRLCDGVVEYGRGVYCDRCLQDRRPAAQDAEQDRRTAAEKEKENEQP